MTAFVQLPDQSWHYAEDLPETPRARQEHLEYLRRRHRRVTVCEHDPETGRSVPCERMLGTDNPGQEREAP